MHRDLALSCGCAHCRRVFPTVLALAVCPTKRASNAAKATEAVTTETWPEGIVYGTRHFHGKCTYSCGHKKNILNYMHNSSYSIPCTDIKTHKKKPQESDP